MNLSFNRVGLGRGSLAKRLYADKDDTATGGRWVTIDDNHVYTITRSGFISTSSGHGVDLTGGNLQVLYTILCQKGTPAISMNNHDSSYHPSENEVVLKSGQHFKVISSVVGNSWIDITLATLPGEESKKKMSSSQLQFSSKKQKSKRYSGSERFCDTAKWTKVS